MALGAGQMSEIEDGIAKDWMLKTCPFCGGQPKMSGTPLNFPCTLARAIVICKCGAQIQREGPVEDFEQYAAAAQTMWNIRYKAPGDMTDMG